MCGTFITRIERDNADMRAGALRHRITIQEPKSSAGALGEKIKSWSDFVTVWAAIEPFRGRELLEAHQREAEITTRFIIRYKSGLNTRMRLKFGSKYYKIESIINLEERNRDLEIMALETEDFS